MPAASSGAVKGSTRWMAPEMYSLVMGADVDGSAKEKGAKEDKSPRDIYAFACTVLEIMTGKPPFHNLLEAAVLYQVGFRRIKPERPSEGWCPDHIWNLAELCWDGDPLRRPKAKALQGYLQRLIEAGNPSPGDPSFIGYFWPDDLNSSPPTSVPESSVDVMPTAGPSQSPNHVHPYSDLPRDFSPAQQPETPHGGILPPSLPNPRDVALFFQEHEHQIDDAVMNTGFSSPSLQRSKNDDKEWIRVALDELRRASPVFTRALDVLSGVHPALGVTVIAYKINIASFYGHSSLARSVVTLMVRIQETMALLLRLPKLSHPEERSIDGLTVWDRLQGLLVEITADIEGAGQFIEDSFHPWSNKLESDLDKKFIGWQYAIKQAFSYYPPSPNFETAILDAAIPRHANGRALADQDAYTNSLVAEFRNENEWGEANTPSPEAVGNSWMSWSSPDPENLPNRNRRLSNPPGSFEQPWSSQPSNLDAILGPSTAPAKSWSDWTIPPPASEPHSLTNPYEVHPPGHHLLPPMTGGNLSSATSSAPSSMDQYIAACPVPSYPGYPTGFFPHPTPQPASSDTSTQLPRIKVHSWLKHAQNDDEFILDFTTRLFDPRQKPKPPNAPMPGGIPLIHRQTLDVAATQPVLTMMYLVFDEDDFVQPCPIPPRLVLHGSPDGITVRELLKYIYVCLNQPIRRSDWDRLDDHGQRAVSTAFYKRCENGGDMAAGTKIVDYLGKRTKFRGIVEVAKSTFKVSAKL
ncbi:MAP kinase kinase kinase [Marasmius tenuissimus]|uniref:MAP kinase kinase kinase n=1 Tax=Marasmius tenuissimus TaxID=585030 RepID=A0ABR2Z6A2_9AGAR